MYPVSFLAGSTIIREGDVGSIVFVMEGEFIIYFAVILIYVTMIGEINDYRFII